MKITIPPIILLLLLAACGKKNEGITNGNSSYTLQTIIVDGINNGGFNFQFTSLKPQVKIAFSESIDRNSLSANLTFRNASQTNIPYTLNYESNDQVIVLEPLQQLSDFSGYTVTVPFSTRSKAGNTLANTVTVNIKTGLDSSNKFALIPNEQLLDSVQRRTFRYFWDFAHPVSGLARERSTSGELVTSGGSGFGIMAIIAAVNRGFITRAEGLARLQKITGFLKNTAQKFHGAFPHWLNGTTGAVIPFSATDDGADLVETAFLVQGLLSARQYFDGASAAEVQLRADINSIYFGVEWDWFRKGNENVLYWHWSPNGGWVKNLPIRGWNEALIVYVLAASSPTHTIPKVVYDEGWARNGNMRNNQSYYGIQLPLGPAQGGPLFFEHYSFLGINPKGLSDAYANYETQAVNHTRINFEYCKANPKNYYGYSNQCWGLTASDIPGGYAASSPANDLGVIAPTAALSSMPYTPVESMAALQFFYYKLGDKIWKQYGFTDAFKLQDPWFATSYLAIDQGPIVAMIENHRSALLWNLFTGCPEVITGMKKLGFTAPYL